MISSSLDGQFYLFIIYCNFILKNYKINIIKCNKYLGYQRY